MYPDGDLAGVDVATLWRAIEAAAEQAGIAVWAARIDCTPPRMVFASPLAAKISGREHASLIGLVPWAILREEDQPKIIEVTRRPLGAPPVSLELVVERPDGEQIPIELAGTRLHTAAGLLAFGYFRDVTAEHATLAALRRSEARFQLLVEAAPDGPLDQADRLASLGTLAAGVAHEINNPLTFIQLSTQRIERVLAASALPEATHAKIREHLRDIEHGISRVASITQSLRTFARVDEAPPGPVDLGAVVERALRMVDNDLRHRARLVRRIAEVPPVTGNGSRLEQVVVNLLLDAIQALPPEGDAAHEIEVSLVQDGEDVNLTIRDTGRGIAPGSKTILDALGGTIALDATEGHGTSVRVTLRVHPARAQPPAPAASPPALPRRRILIVDDERLVREVLARLLAADHEVCTAGDGEEALTAMRQTPFDVIFCDVMMPGINGREVYRRAAEELPGIEQRFVFMSGGTYNAALDQFLAAIPNRKLPKPFKLDQVFAAIEQPLASRSV